MRAVHRIASRPGSALCHWTIADVSTRVVQSRSLARTSVATPLNTRTTHCPSLPISFRGWAPCTTRLQVIAHNPSTYLCFRSFCASDVRRNNAAKSPPKSPAGAQEQHGGVLSGKAKEEGKGLKENAKPGDYARHHNLEEYSRFFRRLALALPPMQRPTRDDFLKVATNFWQRLRIRFKWFTVRSFRPFNVDDMSAFFTWFLMSQTVWIFVGT